MSNTSAEELINHLSEHLEINKHDLDNEIAYQSEMLYQINLLASEADSKRDEAKKELEETYAKAGLEIRRRAIESGNKITEEGVKQFITLEPIYIQAQVNLLRAKKEAQDVNSLKEAFSQRGYMLRTLAELYISGYYAEVTIKTKEVEDAKISTMRRKMREVRRLTSESEIQKS